MKKGPAVIGVTVASLILLGGVGSALQDYRGLSPLAANKGDKVTVYRDRQVSSEISQREAFIALQTMNDSAAGRARFQLGWIPSSTDLFNKYSRTSAVHPVATHVASRTRKPLVAAAIRPTQVKVAADQSGTGLNVR